MRENTDQKNSEYVHFLRSLYFSGETIRASLKTIQKTSLIVEISKKFKQCMAKGNTNSALNLLANNMENVVLQLNKDTNFQNLFKNMQMLRRLHK